MRPYTIGDQCIDLDHVQVIFTDVEAETYLRQQPPDYTRGVVCWRGSYKRIYSSENDRVFLHEGEWGWLHDNPPMPKETAQAIWDAFIAAWKGEGK